jgi:hypothetical protein
MRRLLAIGVLALTACQTSPPKELPYPPQRVFQNAYSFMPPAELGWRVLGRKGHLVFVARNGINTNETFAIQGGARRLPAYGSREEFVEIVRKAVAKGAADQRFNVLKHDMIADTAKETCVRSHLTAEDRAAVTRTAAPGVMVLETMVRFCVHPKYPELVVSVDYSHRRYPEHADPKFTEKADRLLSSLEYLE